MTSNGLFARQGVRYEVAQDVLGAIISHHAAAIAQELDKPQPDQRAIDTASAAKDAVRELRDALDPANASEIEEVIKTFGRQARDLYAPK